jgi:hypothetical protein
LQKSGWEASFSALYGMHIVTLIELKAVSAQAKHSDSLNKILTGIKGPGSQLPGSKGTQDA